VTFGASILLRRFNWPSPARVRISLSKLLNASRYDASHGKHPLTTIIQAWKAKLGELQTELAQSAARSQAREANLQLAHQQAMDRREDEWRAQLQLCEEQAQAKLSALQAKCDSTLASNVSQNKRDVNELVHMHESQLAVLRDTAECVQATTVAKVRTELLAAHNAQLTQERTQLHGAHDAELAQLRSKLQAAHDAEQARLRSELQAAHDAELARLRSELQAAHDAELAQLRSELQAAHDAELAREASQFRTKEQAAQAHLSALQVQLAAATRQAHDDAAARVRLQHSQQELALQRENLSDMHAQELSRLRGDLQESRAGYAELVQQHGALKNQLRQREESEERLRHEGLSLQGQLAELKRQSRRAQEAVAAQQENMQAVRAEHDQVLAVQSKQLSALAAQAAAESKEMREQWSRQQQEFRTRVEEEQTHLQEEHARSQRDIAARHNQELLTLRAAHADELARLREADRVRDHAARVEKQREVQKIHSALLNLVDHATRAPTPGHQLSRSEFLSPNSSDQTSSSTVRGKDGQSELAVGADELGLDWGQACTLIRSTWQRRLDDRSHEAELVARQQQEVHSQLCARLAQANSSRLQISREEKSLKELVARQHAELQQQRASNLALCSLQTEALELARLHKSDRALSSSRSRLITARDSLHEQSMKIALPAEAQLRRQRRERQRKQDHERISASELKRSGRIRPPSSSPRASELENTRQFGKTGTLESRSPSPHELTMRALSGSRKGKEGHFVRDRKVNTRHMVTGSNVDLHESGTNSAKINEVEFGSDDRDAELERLRAVRNV
jgi:hypothetical protein